jgi:malate/lactate dehydrogenase
VAISTLHSGATDELWLHDLDDARAEGEAMDLAHGAWFYPACKVRTADVAAMRDVALSLPTIVDRQGGGRVLVPAMDEAERVALERSAQVLRDARASTGAID